VVEQRRRRHLSQNGELGTRGDFGCGTVGLVTHIVDAGELGSADAFFLRRVGFAGSAAASSATRAGKLLCVQPIQAVEREPMNMSPVINHSLRASKALNF
jgi:hypothetical protein